MTLKPINTLLEIVEIVDLLPKPVNLLVKLLEIGGFEPIASSPAEERRSRLLRSSRLLNALEEIIRQS